MNRLGRHAESLAMEDFRPSFGSNDEAWLYFLKGYRAHMKHDIPAALHYYDKSLSYHPTAEAHTFRGWALSHELRFDEAIACCRRAIERDPDFGNPYNDIGSYLMAQGKLEEAITWFEQAIKAPRYAPRQFPHVNLGLLHEMLGDDALALKHFQKALKIDPAHMMAKRHYVTLAARRN